MDGRTAVQDRILAQGGMTDTRFHLENRPLIFYLAHQTIKKPTLAEDANFLPTHDVKIHISLIYVGF